MTFAYSLSNALIIMYMAYDAAARIADRAISELFIAWTLCFLLLLFIENIIIVLQSNTVYAITRVFIIVLLSFDVNQSIVVKFIDRHFSRFRQFLTDADYRAQQCNHLVSSFRVNVLAKLPDTSCDQPKLTSSRLKFTNANREEHFDQPIVEKAEMQLSVDDHAVIELQAPQPEPEQPGPAEQIDIQQDQEEKCQEVKQDAQDGQVPAEVQPPQPQNIEGWNSDSDSEPPVEVKSPKKKLRLE